VTGVKEDGSGVVPPGRDGVIAVGALLLRKGTCGPPPRGVGEVKDGAPGARVIVRGGEVDPWPTGVFRPVGSEEVTGVVAEGTGLAGVGPPGRCWMLVTGTLLLRSGT
jgi:hypothetical protein